MEFWDHERFDGLPRNCCFTIVTARTSFYLSSPDKNAMQVRLFVSYLKAVVKHFSADRINKYDLERTVKVPIAQIQKCLPTPMQMQAFMHFFKQKGYKEVDVGKFGVAERLWWYCRKLNNVKSRC